MDKDKCLEIIRVNLLASFWDVLLDSGVDFWQSFLFEYHVS
jgi:hypothetical protein